MISRRKFLLGSAVLAAAPAVSLPPSLALADAPAKRQAQAPGYFRLRLGDVEITAVYDGAVTLRPEILHGASPKEVTSLLEDECIAPKAGIPITINAFLINTGRNLVLADTGAGSYFGDKAGLVPENIRAAGYTPEEIDTVLLTHLHSDHALGLTDATGRPIFPGAVVRVRDADAAYWQSDDLFAKADGEKKRFLTALRAAVAPYAASGKLLPFAAGETPVAGVEAVALPGHTPGHTGFRVRSGGQSLLAFGDTVHNAAVQFPRPAVSIDFDENQPVAVSTRKLLMAQVAKESCYIAGPHLAFPGIGHIRPRPRGYAWVPVLYGALQA